jgi:LacI family repressor for deo operon, udp, cdd, tsx, nupC, and nupG
MSTSPKPEIFSGICDASRDRGYDTLLTNTLPNAVGAYAKYVEDGLISGIILLNIRLLAELSDSLLARCPIVQCNEYENVPRANLVTIDNHGATREITEHLIGTGKRRIAFMAPEYAFGYPIKFAVDREYGFRQALEERGLEVNTDFIIRTDYSAFGANYRESVAAFNAAAERLLTLPASKRPDGIVCTNDIMAACCINTARKLGISIPEDLAVTAFDNSITCLLTVPEITSIEQPYYEMGYESAKLLISAIEEKPSITKRVLLDHSMIIRGSTGK